MAGTKQRGAFTVGVRCSLFNAAVFNRGRLKIASLKGERGESVSTLVHFEKSSVETD